MERLSKALQESYTAQGLALGVLAHDVTELPTDKLAFDSAFAHAWRRFPHRNRFPAVLRQTAADPYYAILRRSESRRGSILAAWDTDGPTLVPYLCNDWTVQESGEMLADWSGVPWSDWVELAEVFLADLAAPGARP